MLEKHLIKGFGKIPLHCNWNKKKKETINTGVNKTTKCTVNWARNNDFKSIRKYLHPASRSYSIVGLICLRPPTHVRTFYVSFYVSNNLCIIFAGSDIQLVKGKFLCNNKISYSYFRDGRTNLKSLCIFT